MRKISFALIGCFIAVCTHAAQIVNVDYIHKLITQEWDITVPIKTDNITAAANMKYLLTAVDVANEILNGEKTTDYGNTKFATTQAVDTIATNQAVNTLIKQNKIEYKFSATINQTATCDDCGISYCSFHEISTRLGFYISAAGTFYIDWGDGTQETIVKKNTDFIEYSHDYGTNDALYTIQIGGNATDYSSDMPAIAFWFSTHANDDCASEVVHGITQIDGSLGAIFGTLSNGKQPVFSGLFSTAHQLSSIPENLFAGISGAPAEYMFANTFSYTSITSIPENLFAGISGAPADSMFNNTFSYTSITSIPENLFGNISGTAQRSMFSQTFYNCGLLTGPSARINGKYLYEIWPDATTDQVGDMYYHAKKLDDYRCIPTVWGGGGQTCAPTPEFTLTTMPDARDFSFDISAAGEFTVDWGDGTIETINKTDTDNETYHHAYGTAGAYTIGIGGQATAYNTNDYVAAISFNTLSVYNTQKIASIDGSLGAIFGTLSSDTNNQPRFYRTFYNATNMTGSIPKKLFAGISGAPADSMFSHTFYGCSGLTGAIPDGLFAGISGAPASNMFEYTFSGCSGLTSIPENLFAGISGAPASDMFANTFYGCSGLTGAIPDGLFAGISGAPASGMFSGTFSGCRGLTGAIPDGLFAGISGAPASNMFRSTFYGCSGLTSIPENLFGNISGTAQSNMFSGTFYNCTSLTGPSARINGQYLYEIWKASLWATYKRCTGLSDYSSIPYDWLDN